MILIPPLSVTSISNTEIMQTLNNLTDRRVCLLNYFEQHALFHLTHFIANFSQLYHHFQTNAILRSESLMAMKKWSNYTKLCHSIGDSLFASLSSSTINNIFFGQGLCTAVSLHYLSHFFKTRSPLTFASLPIKSEPIYFSGVNFYSIESLETNEQKLGEKTQHLRFLQATYKMASAYREGDSLEYLPSSLLNNKELQIVRRLPDFKNSKQSFSIQDLIPELKNLADQVVDKGYLMGISRENNSHAIFLYLKPPYHFLDPSYGIAISDQKEDFLLFLANFLTEKYPDYQSFALLEFIKSSESFPS